MSLGCPKQQRATLPEDGLDLLSSASSLLEQVGKQLRSAEIDVNTLRILRNNEATFLDLLSLLPGVDENTASTEKSEASKMTEANKIQQGRSSTKLFLDMRIDELEAFQKERDEVRSFVELCSSDQTGESKPLLKHEHEHFRLFTDYTRRSSEVKLQARNIQWFVSMKCRRKLYFVTWELLFSNGQNVI